VEPLTEETDPSSGLPLRVLSLKDYTEMVLVPAGEFVWGNFRGRPDERPARRIYLDAFYIDLHPVTNAQYRVFLQYIQALDDHRRCYPAEHLALAVKKRNHAPRHWADRRWARREQAERFNGATQPVVGVTWYDAYAYARWAGKMLPTEAQWEKAARGPDGRIWPWGNQWDPERLNFGSRVGRTTPVDQYPQGASPYGCYDMAGNVWEWCLDRYRPNYYAYAPQVNPPGPENGLDRVCRGGAWNYLARYARTTTRQYFGPGDAYQFIGFRCVLPVE